MNVQTIYKFALTAMCGLSFAIMPSKASAESCCAQQDNTCCDQQQDQCCDTGCCGSGWGRTALLVGGAIVAGGIAGAIAGNSHKSHHHHSGSGSGSSGSVGPQGPTGPAGATGAAGESPFVVDDGAAIEFTATFPATFTVDVLGTATSDIEFTFIPFVSTPDGLIIDAQSQFIVGGVVAAGGPGTFPVVVDLPTVSVLVPEDSVVFGTYHFGIEVELDTLGGATSVGFTPGANSIAATAEVSNEEGIEEIGLNPIVLPTTLLTGPTGPEDVQGETEYSYDPDLFLP